MSKGVKRVLSVPDVHAPNHDKRAWNLLLDVCDAVKFDVVHVAGDFADNETVSRHAPTRLKQMRAKEEIASAKNCLRALWNLTGGAERHIFCEGNHETRLQRTILEKLPAIDGLLNIRDMLDPDHDWEWVPYNESTKIGKIHVTHDVGEAGINAHRGATKAFMASAIIGHTHRMEYGVTGRVDGQPVLGAMFGWLGDYRKVDYQHRAKAKQWPLGFGVGIMDKGGIVHMQPVPIINYTCCVFGEIYRG